MALTKVSGDILDTGIVVAGVTTSTNFKTGTSNLHSAGIEIAGINVLGADTPIGAGVTIYNSGGADFTGVVTATRFVGQADISGGSIIATTGTFSGDVSIGGTLTYQDVTNIDSVGLGTFRNGINVTAGVSTFAAAIDANGGANIAGGLVVNSAKISDLTDNRVVIAGTSGELEDSANLTFDGATLNVNGGSTDTPLIVDTTSTNGSHMRFQKDAGNKHFVGSGGGFGLGDIDDLAFRTVDNLIFGVGTSEKLRITSDGYLLVGHNTRDANIAHGTAGRAQLWGTSWANAGIALINTQASTDPAFISFAKSRKASATASAAAVQSGDRLGEIRFAGDDGTDMHSFGASIAAYAEGTIAGNRMPGKLVFATTSDTAGAVNSSTRLVIDQSGHITPGAAGTQDLGSASKEFRHLYLGDSGKAYFGLDQDFSIWHNNSHGLIKNTTGRLYLLSDDLWIKNEADNKTAARFFEGNEVFLYHNDTVRLTTTSTGITVSGEVATSQDYPNYRPTLDLNFAAVKKLDPRITYSRTGTASYTDEFGKVVLVGDNTPRFDHDPVTKESKGLLIEEARTNQWLQSVTLASYVTGGALQQSTLADAGTSTKDPAGGYNATKMAATANGGAHSFYKNFTSGSNTNNHTFSVWVKAAGVDYARIYVDSVGGNLGGPGVTFSTKNTWNVSASGVGTQVATSVVEYPNGWWRLSVTGNFSNRNDYYCHVDLEGGEGDISFTGNNSNGMYVWGAQFENGDLSTSYIPTYGTTVTRAVDYAIIDGTEFSDFYNQSEGTLLSEFTINDRAHADELTSGAIANINALSSVSYANSIMFMEIGTANGYFGRVYKDGNGRQLSYGSSVIANIMGGNTNRVSFAWSDTVVNEGLASYWNGSVVNTEANEDRTPTNMTELRIGQGWGTAHINAHIKRLSYYPKRLPNSQLATLTA